jgi:hypothetical protein
MINPARSNKVTRGKGVWRPRRSVKRPRRKRSPRVINIFGTISIRIKVVLRRMLEKGMPISKVPRAKPCEAIGGHKSWNQYGPFLLFCSITRENSRKKCYGFITHKSEEPKKPDIGFGNRQEIILFEFVCTFLIGRQFFLIKPTFGLFGTKHFR